MGFLMDGIDAEAYDRSYTDRELLTRIRGYFWPHRRKMGLVAGMIVLNSLTEAALPLLIAWGLNMVTTTPNLRAELWQRSWWLILAILIFGALAWCFNFVRQRYTARTVGGCA